MVYQKKSYGIYVFCVKTLLLVSLERKYLFVLLYLFSSYSIFSQVYISPDTKLHFSQVSDTFFSKESVLFLSSDISGDGVLFLSGVDSLLTNDTPVIPTLFVSHSNIYLLGNLEINNALSLKHSNLNIEGHFLNLCYQDYIVIDSNSCLNFIEECSSEGITYSKLYLNKYHTLFFVYENAFFRLKHIDFERLLVENTQPPYSSLFISVYSPPP